MDRKEGPAAANKVRKNLSLLLNFAIRRGYGVTFNPARYAEKRKENPDGFHVWTEAEIARFKRHHAAGTKARLALAIFLCTGASRQDAAAMGWRNVAGARISYRRGKTGVEANLPILPDLAEELAYVSPDQALFLTHSGGKPYKPETLGNWFRDQCNAAAVKGSAHGLRKAGATRLAEAGGTPDEIRAFLAHATNKEGQTYTKKADRARLADSGLAKLGSLDHSEECPTPQNRLDKIGKKSNETNVQAGFVAARRGIEPLFPG
ncbi:tyrosine-type recombinase/integrase [Sedimentitalea xiamensis]|uniref:tyrosine-type recombinase/integrase n=1 Tax=Sedimentitalea xiamensis TaxID=3050037 RepID=UPI00389A9608